MYKYKVSGYELMKREMKNNDLFNSFKEGLNSDR
jgi:hypothetical protein